MASMGTECTDLMEPLGAMMSWGGMTAPDMNCGAIWGAGYPTGIA